MDTTTVIDVLREAVSVALKLGGPMLILSMLVGVVIAIFQAVTGVSYYCDIRMRLRRIHRFLRLTDSLQSQQHALR